MTHTYSLSTLERHVGREIGVSDWFTVDQGRIDMFGAAHYDPDPQHMDPAWAAEHSPYGGTIAYGFQTLSMLSHLTMSLRPEGAAVALNYGFDRVRFISPVPVNSRIRARQSLKEATKRGDSVWVIKTHNIVEIDGQSDPALIADWLGLLAADETDLAGLT